MIDEIEYQVLVAQMKTESEHCDVQETLHKLQAEIRSLSEQQKLAVHQLRHEILTLQGTSQQQAMAVCSTDSSDLCYGQQLYSSDDEDEQRMKLTFMSRLALITPSALKELQTKRTEQKRRAVGVNNLCYGQFEPEGQSEIREDFCSVCRRSGDLLMCDVCSLVYHLQCLDPPLSSVPVGLWSCPKCQALSKLCGGKDDWPGTLALAHSYLTLKAAREDEKQKVKKINEQLTAERKLLEQKASQLDEMILQRQRRRTELIEARTKAEQLYENLRQFVLMFRPH